LAAARQVGSIAHHGLVGQVREIFVRDLLRPLLPQYAGFGTGKIVDHTGAESRQVDVVVYDRRMMPPLVYGVEGAVGLYPVEACIYAIEVKSKVTASASRHATEVGRSVGALAYAPEWCQGGIPRARVATALFAFDSTIATPERERERWIKNQARPHYQITRQSPTGQWQAFDIPPLHIICVARRGYGYFAHDTQSYMWSDGDPEHDEILCWLGGVSNTVLNRTAPPAIPFGHYFLENVTGFTPYQP